jgi:hypothetical protein
MRWIRLAIVLTAVTACGRSPAAAGRIFSGAREVFMRTFARHTVGVVAAFLLVSGCSRTDTLSPSPPPTPPPGAPQITLTGQVMDSDSSGPIAGAVVSINGRYRGTSDESGKYSVTGSLDGGSGITYVSAAGYESDYRFISGVTMDFRLHRIERISAGESKLVTVAPGDSLCVNNVQDFPGLGESYLCRSLRVLASSDGILTIEVVSPESGEHPQVEVETVNAPLCCHERIENPTSLHVAAGIEVRVSVEIPWGSPTSRSFVVNTSLKRE